MTPSKKNNLKMQGKEKAIRIAGWIGLLFCMLVLSKYILFKKNPGYYKHYFTHEYKNYTIKQGWQHANLRLFSTIRLFSSPKVSTEYSYENIGGNIIGFIPLGILLSLLFPFIKNWWRLTGLVFCISLLFETTQLITGVGVFDVDDLLLNTTGGIIGYILYITGKRLMRDESGEDVVVR
jgi:glycopeptide antibiotics resistance protein